MIHAGIDAGSRTIKVVLVEGKTGRIAALGLDDQGVDQAQRAEQLLNRVLEGLRMSRKAVTRIVATGYGRDALDWADRTVTEITCHGRGVRARVPKARTVIDIGGQDSKLLRLGEGGGVYDFVMNDRCAAGTGRFLEMVASRLSVTVSELGAVAIRSRSPAPISSMCVVFAETEIVSLLAHEQPPEDIVAGVQQAVASRVAAMAGRKVMEPVVLTGGVAMVPGMREALSKALGVRVTICPQPQFSGAHGAALMARERG